MMKNFILLMFVSALTCSFQLHSAVDTSIHWLTNFEEAVNQSRNTSKPILILFTGSDWCTWCTKLEKEALNTSDFAQAVGNSFIFLKLDFPLYSGQDPSITTRNKQLQKQFDVRSFPTVILYDGQQNQRIGVTGYRPGGGRQYADQLNKMVNDYYQYRQKMSNLDSGSYPGSELKALYEKAKELGLKEDACKIVKTGMISDQSLYFLTERYRSLVSAGLIQNSEAVALRQQLLSTIDKKNEQQTHYQVAVIDFEAFSEKMEQENYSPELAVAPLIEYIDKFGIEDKSNLWRLQMIISQVYLDKNQMSSALKYAQASYDSAPPSVQFEIAKAIENIKSQLHSTATAAIH